MLHTASRRMRDIASAYLTTSFNIGIGVGALIGAVILDAVGVGVLPYVTAGVTLLAVVVFLAGDVRLRRRRQRSSATRRAAGDGCPQHPTPLRSSRGGSRSRRTTAARREGTTRPRPPPPSAGNARYSTSAIERTVSVQSGASTPSKCSSPMPGTMSAGSQSYACSRLVGPFAQTRPSVASGSYAMSR